MLRFARNDELRRLQPACARFRLITVMISLVRAFHRHADVVGLCLGEGSQVNAELFEVEACDLFVEDLRERIDDTAFVLDAGDSLLALCVEPEVNLGDGLVCEGGTHHEARVTGGAAEVQQAAFGEHEDAMAVGENPFVVLRLDFVTLDARNLLEAGHVDFVVEVADVTDDGAVLHLAHLCCADDAGVAGGGHEDVGVANDFVEGLDFVAFHGGLECANRVDFGDDHAGALTAQGLCAALTHVAVAAHDCNLACHHHVGGAVDAVDEGVAAAIEIVELGLGHGIVHVDCRELEAAGLGHLVKAMHAGSGFFGNAAESFASAGPLLRVLLENLFAGGEEHAPFFAVGCGVEFGYLAGVFEFCTAGHEHGGVATVVHDEVCGLAVRPHESAGGVFPVFFERFALPGEHGHALRIFHGALLADHDGGGSVVLRAEDIAAHPAHVGTEVHERFDEDRGLHRHVEATHDAGTSERLLACIFLAESHQARHFSFGEVEFLAAFNRKVNVLNFVFHVISFFMARFLRA